MWSVYVCVCIYVHVLQGSVMQWLPYQVVKIDFCFKPSDTSKSAYNMHTHFNMQNKVEVHCYAMNGDFLSLA